MSIIHQIIAPKENADTSFLLRRQYFSNNQKVHKNAEILDLETSKTAIILDTPIEGFIEYLFEVGENVNVGDVVANIHNKKYKIKDNQRKKTNSSKNISVKALKIASQHNIDIETINKDFITSKDLIDNRETKDQKQINHQSYSYDERDFLKVVNIDGNRLLAKNMMCESSTTIPHSFVEFEFIANELIKKIEIASKENRSFITLLSLVISALSKSLQEMSIFNSYRQNDKIFKYKDINVGIVVKDNNSLSIPVLKAAHKLSPADIAKKLLSIRMDIARGTPNIRDFEGGTFTVSPLDHSSITKVIPIIHPRQAAVIAIPRIKEELFLNDEKEIIVQKKIILCMSFDHSYLDASLAEEFLIKIRDNITLISKNL